MQIREVTLEEMKDVYYLSQQAFTHGRRDPNWQPSADAAQLTRYGVYDENGLQQKVVVLNYRTHLGPDVVVPMGGVAGVSCLPASRGKGYTGACMDYSLERMRDAGQVISVLYPFSWAFYRKHGYEWVGEQREYKVLSRVLKSTPETEFVRAAKPADRSTVLDVAVNISSPNTQNLRELQKDDALDALLSAIKLRQAALADQHGRYVPIALKIAPDLDEAQIAAIAALLMVHRVDAVIATNTTLAREAVQGLPHANEAGGLSGRPLREASTRVIRALSHHLQNAVPIIGVGGIHTGADAAEKIAAGATLVQLYSGLIYQGPRLISDCVRALTVAPTAAHESPALNEKALLDEV